MSVLALVLLQLSSNGGGRFPVTQRLITKVNQRLDSVRVLVQEMIMSLGSEQRKQEACVHLYGVSSFASLLAMKREQNQELAAIIGLLHNYYFFKTGVKDFPGPNSADTVILY